MLLTMAKKNEVQSDVAPRLDRVGGTSRLSLPINEDGSIQWDSVRDATKEKFASAIANDPVALEALSSALGVTEESGEALPEEMQLTDERVGVALDAFNSLFALGFGWGVKTFLKNPFQIDKRTGRPIPLEIPVPVLLQKFALTKEQHAELDPLVRKEAERHTDAIPQWVKDNYGLIMILGLWGKYSFQNGMECVKAQLMYERQQAIKAQQASAPPVRPPDSDMKGNGDARSVRDIENGIPTDWDKPMPEEPPPPMV